MKTQLNIAKKHQKRIAIDTLRMTDAGAAIMGGMDKLQARFFLLQIGYSSAQIEAIESDKTRRQLPI